MTNLQAPRLLAASLTAVLALALAGCQSGMTYGTGKSPGMQTLEDLAGIAALSGEKKEPIDYTPRPKVVLPPTVAQLPPPARLAPVSILPLLLTKSPSTLPPPPNALSLVPSPLRRMTKW